MSTYIELEIQSYLKKDLDLDSIFDQLVQNIEDNPDFFTSENVFAIANFCINARLHGKLLDFILRHIEKENFPIPWPYFLEALSRYPHELDEKTILVLIEGIEAEQAQEQASRSTALITAMPPLKEWLALRKYKTQKDFLNKKSALLDELKNLRAAKLFEKEKILLGRLQKMYGNDADIIKELREHKERYAHEILHRYAAKKKSLKTEDLTFLDPKIESARKVLMENLLETAEKNPDLALHLALIAFVSESYEEALQILTFADENPSLIWFRLEILLQARHYLDLLNELAKVELYFANEPETFFATAYLRAQALWGLEQKHTAIEILESLLAARPQYRAASALLNIWRGR